MTGRVVVYAKLLGLVLLLVAYLELRDHAQLATLQADAAREQAQTFSNLEDGELWLDRVASAEKALNNWRSGIWTAQTPGVAAARIQGVLKETADSVGFQPANPEVSPTPINVNDQQALRFDLSGRADRSAIIELLSWMALHSPRLIVTDVNANFGPRNSIVQLSGLAPFRPTPDQPRADESAQTNAKS